MADQQSVFVLGGEPRQAKRIGGLALIAARHADDGAWSFACEDTQREAHQRNRYPIVVRMRQQRQQVWLGAPPVADTQPATQPVAAIIDERGGWRFQQRHVPGAPTSGAGEDELLTGERLGHLHAPGRAGVVETQQAPGVAPPPRT